MNVKEFLLNLIGSFFILLSISAVLYSIYFRKLYQIFWMCYICLGLIGIGILKRDSYLVTAQINILFIPMIIWNIDFFYFAFFQKPLWRITDYYFLNQQSISRFITLQHFYTIPLAIFALILINSERTNSWKLSFAEGSLIFFLTRLFVSNYKSLNINCAFYPCVFHNIFPFKIYALIWFSVLFLMCFISNKIINQILL
ncbi:MAG: hypothetical protein ACOYT4_03295 [Nanoarchaeota archaeon]